MGSPDAGVYAFLRSGFRHRLDRPFLTIPGGRTWTYREVDDLAARMAAVLRGSGVRPSDRVAVQVGKSAEAVALYLACLRLGAVYLPLNTAYTTDEVSFFVGDADASLVVCDPGVEPDLGPVIRQPHVVTLGTDGSGSLLEQAASAAPNERVAEQLPDAVVAMLYTSGTTGRSKGAMLTAANLTTNAAALREIWRWQPDDVLLHVLPIFHVHGLFVALHCAMLDGGEVIFSSRFEARSVLEQLPNATVMMGVPTHYVRLLDAGIDARVCRNVRLFTSGSAPMTRDVHRRFSDATGHRILERYGMTETGMITSNPYDGDRVPGTVGHPLPGVEVRVVDEHGTPVAAGVDGHVEVRGPNVFAGYWRMPEKTAAEFRPGGWFHTGDLGRLDPDNRLTLRGRASDLIISGGLNVYPREVEAVIDAIDGVVESAVVGIPHSDLGEAVAAFVVADASVTISSILEGLSGLARFKHPRRIRFVDELPRNAMSKVQKAVLRKRYRGEFDPGP